jgi:Tol biopolymer transport system component
VIALLLSACGTTSAPVTSPSPSAGITALTGHVIFTRAGGTYGDETVFVAKVDGTDEHQLSELTHGCCPWATRDGSRIVFAANAPDLRVTAEIENLDGSHRVLLPLPKGKLSLAAGPLSPDGTLVALEGFDDAHSSAEGVYLARASDGGDRKRVTSKYFAPGDFSPDGKQLLLFQNSSTEHPIPGSLWLVNVDGSGLHQLTAPETMVQCCFNYRWSPDGTKILFAAEGSLWTIAPDGSGLTQVFKTVEGRNAITPTWSPDGSMIMFALDPTPNPFNHPVNGLYVIFADGSGLKQVIGGDDFKREPVWVSG